MILGSNFTKSDFVSGISKHILDSVQWDWISGLNGRPITWSVKAKAIQDVDEFVSSSDLELFNIIVMFYQLFELILTAPIHCRGSIGEQVT